jgi:predicted RNA binding protein YcfA (HicA-like mRNA interferase family)
VSRGPQSQEANGPQAGRDHRRSACGRLGVSSAELPIVKPRELVRALERMGFHLLRKSKGSHWQFEHPERPSGTVLVDRGRDVGPGLVRKIPHGIESFRRAGGPEHGEGGCV